jgi:hypothetical protein
MTATMGYDLHQLHDGHFMPMGTDLALCSGQRHVRVLTVPYFCGERTLRDEWNVVFRGRDHDEVVIWLPADDER